MIISFEEEPQQQEIVVEASSDQEQPDKESIEDISKPQSPDTPQEKFAQEENNSAANKESEEEKPKLLEKKDFLQDHQEAAPGNTFEKSFMQTLLVLIGLLLLILFGVWLIKKFSGSRMRQVNAGKTIKILERRPLSHKSMLYLIDIRGKQILLAESQLEVRPISNLEWIDEEKSV
jgi:flagellar protein FliO/FliZ